MFKRTKATRDGNTIKITAELKDGLIAQRVYFTKSYQEAYIKLEKEFK